MLLVLQIGFSKAQYSSIKTTGMQVPQYMASGSTARLPVFAKLRMDGFTPNSKYKYIVKMMKSSELYQYSDTAIGSGGNLYIDSQGNYRYATTTSFKTTGGCDTLSSDMTGAVEGWFSVVNDGNSRFTAGNKLYLAVTILSISNPNDTLRYFCQDSITVLQWGTTANSNSGTAVWGKSMASAKSFAGLFDNVNGTGRPLSIANIENSSYSGASYSSIVKFLSDSVVGKSGRWGTIIPNNLASGVKRIDNLSFSNGFSVYANTDTNAIWGVNNRNTKNPSGGATSPIIFTVDDAPMIAPKIEFWTRTSTIGEGAGKFNVYVTRKYSNSDNQSVRLYVVGGTASKGASADYDVVEPKVIKFKPGVAISDTTVITLNDDNIAEGSETIVLRLDQAVNCLIGTEVAHTATVTDNDIANISILPAKIKVKESAGTVGIKIKIDKAVNTACKLRLMVKYKADSTFIPAEFSLSSNNNDTTFNLGKTTGPDSIIIKGKVFDDIMSDKDDSLIVVVRQITGGGLISKDSLGTIIIMDNDGPSTVKFIGSGITVKENVGSVNIKMLLVNKKDAGGDFTFRLYTALSTAQNPGDFKFNPASKIFNVTSTTSDTLSISIPIVDDNIFEVTENMKFGLANLSNFYIAKSDTFNVLIKDDDYPIYPIGKINKQTKINKAADSLNVKCRIYGTVYGVNLKSTGLEFTMMDNTGGIGVLSATNNFGYTLKEGDSIMVQGSVNQNQGYAQMDKLDTIIKISNNNKMVSPVSVTKINETTESKLVQLNRVKLVDIAEWPTTALSANTNKFVRVISTSGNVDTLNIDAETNISGMATPTGYINVIGIGTQMDATSPFTTKYYLTPRKISDISVSSLPTVKFMNGKDSVFELADSFKMDISVFPSDENFTFDVVCLGGTAASPADYDFANKTIIVTKNNNYFSVKTNITDDLIYQGDLFLTFAIRNIKGPGAYGKDSLMILTIKDNEASAVKDFSQGNFKMYPNPAVETINFNNAQNIAKVEFIDLSGRIVKSFKNTNFSNSELNVQLDNFKGMLFVRITNLAGQSFVDRLFVK